MRCEGQKWKSMPYDKSGMPEWQYDSAKCEEGRRGAARGDASDFEPLSQEANPKSDSHFTQWLNPVAHSRHRV